MAGKRRKQEVTNSITKRPKCLATEEEADVAIRSLLPGPSDEKSFCAAFSEDYQRLASLAVESGPTIPTADESSSDSDDDAESTRQKPPPPEVRTIVGTLAVTGSAWFAHPEGPGRLVDVLAERLTPMMRPDLPRATVCWLFQVLRRVIGYRAMVQQGPGMSEVGSGGGQLLCQLLLRLALTCGPRGWDGPGASAADSEAARLLEVVAICDPTLRSFWYSLATTIPEADGRPIGTGMLHMLATRKTLVAQALAADVIDYITFVIALRNVSASPGLAPPAVLQILRLLCAASPPQLTAAVRSTESPLLKALAKRCGPAIGDQVLGTHLFGAATLDDCWALHKFWSATPPEQQFYVDVEKEDGAETTTPAAVVD
eukprot:TRINITY_DN1717_c0_g1_i1.p1 TRINITY_DN1717_c0_g1~~TRINITY_DN1717_c0_g1_i1.p1  ORF type:complete len:372 (-),score=32.28 TRINITY_DN1717_c0_g1_i1:134-1249(-)